MGLPENQWVSITAKYPKGPKNKITDVPGVTVGHVTIEDGKKDVHTGVTAHPAPSGQSF